MQSQKKRRLNPNDATPDARPKKGITFDEAYAIFSSAYNRPGITELENVEGSKVYWEGQACTPSQKRLRYMTVKSPGHWKLTVTRGNVKYGIAKNPDRKTREPITFERAYSLFLNTYNRPGHSELEAKDPSEAFWNSQIGVRPSVRTLRYRHLNDGVPGPWKKTCVFDGAQRGHARNRTCDEKVMARRSAMLRLRPEERHRTNLEARAIASFRRLVSDIAKQMHIEYVCILNAPGGLKVDALMQITRNDLFIGLQFKSCTWKENGLMQFSGTNGYNMPVICVAMEGETPRQWLLFEHVTKQSVLLHSSKTSSIQDKAQL